MPRGQEVAKKATFGHDDKRAQYARLVVFNHGVKTKLISKDRDVNSATNAELEKAGKDLTGGNLLEGPGGIEVIQALSKKGSTTGRELTKAYAQEVRPFLRRLALSDSFGRRSKPRAAKPTAETKKAAPKKAAKGAAKKSTAKKGGTDSQSSEQSAPAETSQTPEVEPAGEPVAVEA